ncbi:protein-L-isoaspartate O-methyltransferase [Parvibaculum sp.]|jgi:protein-L-isoaspartate(D-aspartate) O-methyltransferase|uniref:protein-L-isoaspartate O-methyltransferase family protein n=1 Tax=Parvibaculum sp. TaxID=2024848 RepID=UPI000C4BBD71|nr:protein-L-isoaspartate O-methyltransferase [Parvibaculum sp.]MAM93689.1 protein-L-isoaspartate O-methyltransferase [Parvibaculum sp.]HCX67722.1 protein-L-isoaspartate O-methyltransferase [Rhodobiaceae bacterium]|tara:strand:+ start:6739 stop:7401 length:663 start_codon:yes stop_codon:yes gene_type:complete
MTDFAAARHNMVESQVRVNSVTDERVIDALAAVPRERFVPTARQGIAYMDEDVKIADGTPPRFLMEPRVFAKLVQLAEIGADDLVLDVGCGSGYSTAVLSRVAGTVVALECDEALAAQAGATLSDLSVDNAVVVTGALPEGYAKQAPYDVIFINGMVSSVPESLQKQLREDGRLVCVLGDGVSGRARLYVRSGDSFSGRDAFDANVRFLPGFEPVESFVF